jgi:hypothetical protein
MGFRTLSRIIRVFHRYRPDLMIRGPSNNSSRDLGSCRGLYRLLSLMIRSSWILLLPKPNPIPPILETIQLLPVVPSEMGVDRNERISPLLLFECEPLLILLPIELRVRIRFSQTRLKRELDTKLPFDLLGPPGRTHPLRAGMGGCNSLHLLIRLLHWVWLLLMLYPLRLDLV